MTVSRWVVAPFVPGRLAADAGVAAYPAAARTPAAVPPSTVRRRSVLGRELGGVPGDAAGSPAGVVDEECWSDDDM
jgi:hypothetical protein